MRIKKFEKYTKLEVSWDDTKSDPEWQSEKDIPRLDSEPIKTLGFYIKTQKRNLILAHSVSRDGDFDTTIIPWGVIRNVEELGVKVGGNEQI